MTSELIASAFDHYANDDILLLEVYGAQVRVTMGSAYDLTSPVNTSG